MQRRLFSLSAATIGLTLSVLTTSQVAAQTASRIAERFTQPGPGSVNTWWIDAPQGLIIIDFQRDTETAAQAIARIRTGGRPVAALLLTHPHPDHIGGLNIYFWVVAAAKLPEGFRPKGSHLSPP